MVFASNILGLGKDNLLKVRIHLAFRPNTFADSL